MAYVRQRGAKYYVTYRDEQGKWVEMRTEARTKTEARRLADDLERRAERVRLSLEEAKPEPITFAAFAEIWSKRVASMRRNHRTLVSRVRVHLVPAFGDLQLGDITTELVEDFLQGKAGSLSPCTREHLRRQLRAMFNAAVRWKRLAGANPVTAVPPIEIPRRPVQYAPANVLGDLLAAVPERWRGIFAVAIFTGMRKGEIGGLSWTDVDLERRAIVVKRSWDRPTTKSGRDRVVPIAAGLLPYLVAQRKVASGSLVFPMPDGSMMPDNIKLVPILKRALIRAGIVEGYKLVCRRKGCGHHEQRAANDEVRCPRCDMKLWASPIPRKLTFHNLRHTFGTHLREHSRDISLVQRLLGHSSPELTAQVYAHVLDDYALAQVDAAFGTGSANQPEGSQSASTAVSQPSDPANENLVRTAGVEPATFGFGDRSGNFARLRFAA